MMTVGVENLAKLKRQHFGMPSAPFLLSILYCSAWVEVG